VTAERLYAALGPWTVPDEAQGWPLLRWCQVVAAPAAVVESYVADTDTQVGWRPLLDPALCPADALPFLGQFVGAQVPVGSDEVTARAIVTHSPGWARGTPGAVAAAARLWLTGGQHVTLNERFGGSAYAIEVVVYAGEVIDLVSLTAAVKAALPAGFSLTVSAVTGWTIADAETRYAVLTIADVEAIWSGRTIADAEAELP
jgi:hypothetical protein